MESDLAQLVHYIHLTTTARQKAVIYFADSMGSYRCKVDIEIAAMDGGDEPQAVRSTVCAR